MILFEEFSLPLLAGLTVGFVVIAIYLLVYRYQGQRWLDWLRQPENQTRINNLPKHDLGQLSTNQRGSSMLTMGTIFVAASFLILIGSTERMISPEVRFILAFASPLVYGWWLFSIQLTSRLMDDVDLEILITNLTIREENNALARLHRDLYGPAHGRWLLIWLRRNHWLFYMIALIIGASFVLAYPSVAS